jgi:ribosomal protein L7/L12
MKIAIAVLVVGFVLALLIRARGNARTSLPPARGPLPASGKRDEIIRELLRSGRKIEAIKHYRQQYGTGLKEAKEAIERMEPETRDLRRETRDF